MSSIRVWARLFCVTAVCSTFLGCGKTNEQAPVLGSTAKHPATWTADHRAAYRLTPYQCSECHGADLKGGITKIDCFNQAGLGTCHAKGHGPRNITHVLPYTTPALHGVAAKKDLTICKDCHGTAGGAGSNPRFNLTISSALPTGCESSGCHATKMAHPKPWGSHGASGNQANACALCHGANFEGGSGPSCKSCHTALVGTQLPTAGSCVSCHGNPPGTGSHAAHVALPELSSNCTACHVGGGSGSAIHSAGSVIVGISTAFSAKSGAAAYSSSGKNCANVICHGGQATPVWGAAHITDCLKCHASGTAQYNSFFSGQHTKHVTDQHLACTDCHDTAKLAPGHFSNLSSAALTQLPAATLRSYLNYTKPTCSPTSVPAGNQVTVCHGGKTW